MAIIELQIRREAFVSFFVNEINRQRLPARSVDAFEEIKGKLLQRIECTGATVEPSAGTRRVIVQADLSSRRSGVRIDAEEPVPVQERLRASIVRPSQ